MHDENGDLVVIMYIICILCIIMYFDVTHFHDGH